MSISEGQNIYNLANKIFPYCRSITGEGVRKTLEDINRYIVKKSGLQMDIHSVKSGTNVYDWTIPNEWQITEAYIEDEAGNRIIDMQANNLHILGYSISVDKWVSLKELQDCIYTLPDQPDCIPYVTSYYKKRFGFCMSQKQFNSLSKEKYHIYIDSRHFDGVLNYSELLIPGECQQEIFFSTYICHPSMANNECSGPALMAELINYVANMINRKYTYRFIMIPETIGSITYLSQENHLSYLQKNMLAGFNLSCVGDDRDYSIVESRYGNTIADKILNNVLYYHTNDKYSKYSFLQRGSDERQYGAPGVDLPVVGYCRSKYGEFPEYHTSADNMSLISPSGFQGSYDVMVKVIEGLENNAKYRIKILCEPQLGKRGLYPTLSKKNSTYVVRDMLNFIAYADGKNDLVDISNIINVPIEELISIMKKLKDNNLLDIC